MLSVLWFNSGSALAQDGGLVQELAGDLGSGELNLYQLPGLREGQVLYVYLDGISGNLDPIAGVLVQGADIVTLRQQFLAETEAALASSDPREAINAVRDKYFLAWDDDSGEGYAAALEFTVPDSGDYSLIVSGALSSVGRSSFGDYRLLVGLDAPQVLTGQAETTGDEIAFADREAIPAGIAVEQVTGALTAERPQTFVALDDFDPGDTLYVYLEATSGDLSPVAILRDFGQKPVNGGNLSGAETTASFQYTTPEGGRNYVIAISDWNGDDQFQAGEYRLLVGVNAPGVLSGSAEPTESSAIRDPIEVQVGVKLQQIYQVDQQNEFFSVVSSMQMEWTDPALAFSPDTCDCQAKIYTEKEFDRFLADVAGRWPDFTLTNQQGNRWVQNRVVVLYPEGRGVYLERFSTNFQVDFDFRRFPFDTQQFNIRVDMLYPEEFYYFADLPGYTEISQEHGEDEFIITGFETSVTSERISTQSVTSRFTFRFEAPRHLDYYVFRIFVPILLIVMVSWVTFFLKDYVRRIEVATGNLLLFIAFSFSLSDNYPRLGYLTFLDALMAITFSVNAFVVIYNVLMRRLEMAGKIEQVERIDNVLDWAYPFIYVIPLAIVFVVFF